MVYGWQYVLVCCCILHTCANCQQSGARMFVTMLGYPSTCSLGKSSHSCTLSLACWLVGGASHPGCGGSPWLVACCVTPYNKKKQHIKEDIEILSHYQSDAIEHVDKIVGLQELHARNPPSVFQRRADEGMLEEEECGLQADRMLYKRIIGGKEARFAQFPWQAHIRILQYQCGGVLVSRQFVATAAHCIIRARLSDITVYLGELDTQDTGQVLELAPAEYHRVYRKIIHPDFQFRTTQPDRYDLALLQLQTTAGHMFHISPVCLPPPGLSFQGYSGVVAGWGKIKPSTELTGTNVLRSASVPILDISECIQWHDRKQINVELGEDMLCAGHADGSQDACLGDSGGPLIVLLDHRWTLAGITSAGFGCGEPHQPGIYHNVAMTADWIRTILSKYN